MNLSILERMAREGDISHDCIKYLLECRAECEWLDYKEMLSFDSDKLLCDFARDVIGIKNVGGGYLVIGVKDKTWDPIGLKTPLSFDSKLLRDKVRRASGLDLDVTLVHHTLHISGLNRTFAVIFVRSTKKRKRRRMPSVVGIDYCPREPFGFRRGEIFVRKGDSTVKVSSETELEELLDNLEAQSDEDAVQLSNRPSPYAIQEGPYRILERGFESFVGRQKLRETLLAAVESDPRIWIINVHGPGGVGKSALVNWAIFDVFSRKLFEAILQLTAKESQLTPTGIRSHTRSLYSLENLLDSIIELFEEPVPSELDAKKKAAIDLLGVWKTLLVLDNMETVQDGRILEFIRSLPEGNRTKVVLTSRNLTGGWELPVPVNELSEKEVGEFLQIKSAELKIDFPSDDATVKAVWKSSGGLPLAIQWILGRQKIAKDLKGVLTAVNEKESPVLEFSFRNIWNVLSPDARSTLAVLTIFEDAPTLQQITVATERSNEQTEKALVELANVTLITKVTQPSDGRITYNALPITLAFARHQLGTMGEYETQCRQRYQRFTEQMKLQDSEIYRFKNIYMQYGLSTDNEKRAAILCRRGESEVFVGNTDNADESFKQARNLAPASAYVYAMSASYELARTRVGYALDFAKEACKRATKETGALAFTILARVYDAQRDRNGKVQALENALKYDPLDTGLRHQYGVALSRAGFPADAIKQFGIIIEAEQRRTPARDTLLMAIKTRMINNRRLKSESEVQKDLTLAKDIMKLNPHLQHHGSQFLEFESADD